MLKNLFNEFDEKTELIDVRCENCSIIYGKISRSNFENYQSLLNTPMQLIIIVQKWAFYHNIPCHFQVVMILFIYYVLNKYPSS